MEARPQVGLGARSVMGSLSIPMTRHAERRTNERSIPEIGVWLLMEFGARRADRDGTESISFDKRSWKEVERFCGVWPLKKMDQLRRIYMIVNENGAAVTVAYRD